MKILVIDDTEMHRLSALETLSGHDVNVVSTWMEAVEKLSPALYDYEGDRFDVVLADLLMPAEEGFDETGLVPVGIPLALMAAKAGATHVGVLTDANHHHCFAAHTLDYIESGDGKRCLTIEGAKVGFFVAKYPHQKTQSGAKDWGRILRFLLAA